MRVCNHFQVDYTALRFPSGSTNIIYDLEKMVETPWSKSCPGHWSELKLITNHSCTIFINCIYISFTWPSFIPHTNPLIIHKERLYYCSSLYTLCIHYRNIGISLNDAYANNGGSYRAQDGPIDLSSTVS